MSARLFGDRQVEMPLSVVKDIRSALVLVTVAVLALDGTHAFEPSQEAGLLIWFSMRTLSPTLNFTLFVSWFGNASLHCLNDGELSRRRSLC
jgi:hypothetical protein